MAEDTNTREKNLDQRNSGNRRPGFFMPGTGCSPAQKSLSRKEAIPGPGSQKPSEVLSNALGLIYSQGFPIYKLLGRVKKELGWDKKRMFPEAVLLRVCDVYHCVQNPIKDKWPWFVKVLKMECSRYYADQEMSMSESLRGEVKDHSATIESLGEILERLRRNNGDN